MQTPDENQDKMEEPSGNSTGSTVVESETANVARKEKITSKLHVLGDTGSQWSGLTSVDDPSLATTAKTLAPTSVASETPLRQAIKKGVAEKVKKIDLNEKIKLPDLADDKSAYSVRESLRSKAKSKGFPQSLPASSQVLPDHASELLNEAVLMDRTLDEIQKDSRPRPKNQLLGE